MQRATFLAHDVRLRLKVSTACTCIFFCQITPETLKARQKAKALAWEMELKSKKEVRPMLRVGPYWLGGPACSVKEHVDLLVQFEVSFNNQFIYEMRLCLIIIYIKDYRLKCFPQLQSDFSLKDSKK